MKSFLAEATETYHRAIRPEEQSPVVEYLKSRALRWASVQSFKLGYVENPLPGHEKYQGRLAIPYLTRSGVVKMRFRAIPPNAGGAKYLDVAGAIPRIFNTGDLDRHEPYVCITEGEIDCITAHQAGLPAVGIPGVEGWQPWYALIFGGYEAVYILADNDDSGQGAAFAERVAAQIENARVVLMPEGHDVNSLVTAEGSAALIEKVRGRK